MTLATRVFAKPICVLASVLLTLTSISWNDGAWAESHSITKAHKGGALKPSFSPLSDTAHDAPVVLKGGVDVLSSYCNLAGLELSAQTVPATVKSVHPQTPAAAANISMGDHILSGKLVDSHLKLEIERNGAKHLASIPLFPEKAPVAPVRLKRPATVAVGRRPAVVAVARRPAVAPLVPHPALPVLKAQVNQVFSPQHIAVLGAAGVEQSHYPNCWFEGCLSAMAQSDKGRRTLASMVARSASGNFSVTFLDEQRPREIANSDILSFRVTDSGDWAEVFESAELQRFPDNDPAYMPQNGNPKIKRGLEMLTGKTITFERPENMTTAQLATTIQHSLSRQDPIVVATKSPMENGFLPQVITPNHCYSIVSFDQASGYVTIRNPFGREDFQKQAQNQGDPEKRRATQVEDLRSQLERRHEQLEERRARMEQRLAASGRYGDATGAAAAAQDEYARTLERVDTRYNDDLRRLTDDRSQQQPTANRDYANNVSSDITYLDGGMVELKLSSIQAYCRFIAWPNN